MFEAVLNKNSFAADFERNYSNYNIVGCHFIYLITVFETGYHYI